MNPTSPHALTLMPWCNAMAKSLSLLRANSNLGTVQLWATEKSTKLGHRKGYRLVFVPINVRVGMLGGVMQGRLVNCYIHLYLQVNSSLLFTSHDTTAFIYLGEYPS